MSYAEFLQDIEKYVGKVVEFTSRWKADGKITRHQRIVWSSKEFGMPSEDALFEIINVEIVK